MECNTELKKDHLVWETHFLGKQRICSTKRLLNKYQDLSFQSIKVEQISVDVDPLLIHEIKEEYLEENEATPIQDLTEVYIKQEVFDASEYQNEQRNGTVVQEIKKEFVLGE